MGPRTDHRWSRCASCWASSARTSGGIKGIDIPAAGGRIHPHYGVFAPVRREYVDLVAKAPLPAATAATSVAFDIGTGTGVLAAVLARRGLARVIATDQDPRALACARENIERLGLRDKVEVIAGRPLSGGTRRARGVQSAVGARAARARRSNTASTILRAGCCADFSRDSPRTWYPAGEGWLILSDLAEHLGLRTRAELLEAIEAAALRVVDRTDVRPVHPKASDATDPLHAARAAEVTSLWRLAVR